MSYFYSLAELSWDLIGLWHKHIASDKYGSTANVYFFLSQIWRKKIKIIFFMNYNCSSMGFRPTNIPGYHDENWFTTTRRKYQIFKKVFNP
jgi:hypothetical protein